MSRSSSTCAHCCWWCRWWGFSRSQFSTTHDINIIFIFYLQITVIRVYFDIRRIRFGCDVVAIAIDKPHIASGVWLRVGAGWCLRNEISINLNTPMDYWFGWIDAHVKGERRGIWLAFERDQFGSAAAWSHEHSDGEWVVRWKATA